MQVSGQLHAPGCFTLGERAHAKQWKGSFVGPRTGLDAAKKKRNIIAPAGN
jgi:hypothetical protein